MVARVPGRPLPRATFSLVPPPLLLFIGPEIMVDVAGGSGTSVLDEDSKKDEKGDDDAEVPEVPCADEEDDVNDDKEVSEVLCPDDEEDDNVKDDEGMSEILCTGEEEDDDDNDVEDGKELARVIAYIVERLLGGGAENVSSIGFEKSAEPSSFVPQQRQIWFWLS